MEISISASNKKPRIQGAVVPYIVEGGKLKVILIKSKHKGNWGLPKGGIEDHLSKKQSAELEALEEAGLKGKAGKKMGTYRYIKGKTGRMQIVHVYPFQVKKQLDKYLEADWRIRKTFDVKLAAQKVDKNQAVFIKNIFKMFKAGKLV